MRRRREVEPKAEDGGDEQSPSGGPAEGSKQGASGGASACPKASAAKSPKAERPADGESLASKIKSLRARLESLWDQSMIVSGLAAFCMGVGTFSALLLFLNRLAAFQRQSSDVGPEALGAVFAPARGSDGNYPIDAETSGLIGLLELSDTKAASRVRKQLEDSPLQLGARLGLCDSLERHPPPNQTRDQRLARFALCYRRFMDAFAYAQTLRPQDARRQLILQMIETSGRAAGERMLLYADGSRGRLDEAVSYLRQGLPSARECKPAGECMQAYANLLLGLRMQGAPQAELEAALQEARLVPGLQLDWQDVRSVHQQLPGIRHRGVWDSSAMPWLAEVSSRWADIRGELDRYLQARASAGAGMAWEHRPESEYLAGAATWNSIALSTQGEWDDGACQDFPATCSVLRGRPELDPKKYKRPTAASKKNGWAQAEKTPVVMVNIYQALPGARIRPHFGTHCRLVASLGLRTPAGSVLRVGGENRTWEEGSWILFDDSFEHEVFNDAAEPRYVLAVAMLHPDCCSACTRTPR